MPPGSFLPYKYSRGTIPFFIPLPPGHPPPPHPASPAALLLLPFTVLLLAPSLSCPFFFYPSPSPFHIVSMEFDHAPKTPSYMDAMETSFSNYMDSEYLRYPPSPSSFEQSMDRESSATISVNCVSPLTISANIVPPSPTTFSSLHNHINLAHTLNEAYYSSSSSPPAAPTPIAAPFNPPTRPYTPIDGASISPPSLLGPSYTLSAGEMSSDGLTSGRRSRGSGSHSPPATFPAGTAAAAAAAVPRSLSLSSHRFNPIASPPTRTRAPRRKPTRRDDDSDEEDDDFQPTANSLMGGADSRRETIRKQRIESEQRRRDELRDGYARLKDTLPATNQKSSKVSLLDRATNHVRNLEIAKGELEKRLKEAESEVKHLRHINEVLSVRAVNQQRGIASF
ncbi:hypothetical protein MVEN_01499500 [Mycena venus]|uniref:BHLH domain-containing protein n=1 Tax=Mycena venus TaxID=2733690 RepID=A0A8H6XW22_9AGAR|nr:hypothetical protein MVEN_01499500 [Mycena venus]